MLAKSLSFLAGADSAGIVLGARVPIILTSRADSLMARLASCAVAALIAKFRRDQAASRTVVRSTWKQKSTRSSPAGRLLSSESPMISRSPMAARKPSGQPAPTLAITWLNEKARPHVEPLAAELEAEITAALDVSKPGELEALFETIQRSGDASTCWFIRSPSRRKPTCRAAC